MAIYKNLKIKKYKSNILFLQFNNNTRNLIKIIFLSEYWLMQNLILFRIKTKEFVKMGPKFNTL